VQELTTAGFDSLWPAYVRGLTDLQWARGRWRRRSFENCSIIQESSAEQW